MTTGEQPNAAEPIQSDVDENEEDYIITRDETNYADHAAQSLNERLNDDVTKKNEASNATGNEESDWPNPAGYQKIKENPRRLRTKVRKIMEIFLKETCRMKTMHNVLHTGGMILSCPKYPRMIPEMKV